LVFHIQPVDERVGAQMIAVLTMLVALTQACVRISSTLLMCVVATVAYSQADDGVKRQKLWAQLMSGLPNTISRIDVYAEDTSLSAICFRSQGVTYLFDGTSNRLSPVEHAKALPKGSVNQITFVAHRDRPGGAFILWSNGQRQLSVGFHSKLTDQHSMMNWPGSQ
jgi:hypothetical protein